MSVSRRTVIAGAGGVWLGAAAANLRSPAAAAAARPHATLTWLGTAGWRIDSPTTTVLVDPYLSRFDTGLSAGRFDPTTTLKVDPAAIDAALGPSSSADARVDAVLVTHTHWDHFADVPHIARTRGATVFSTLTGYQLGLAMGVPASQLAVVRGAEELNVGDLVVRPVRSLHSRTGTGGLLFPGVRTEVPAAPQTIGDLPEGDTLAYLVRTPHGGSVLLMGGSDFDDQALQGLSPDIVAMPVPSNSVTAGYVPRLMSVVGRPRVVVPVHWDSFETPLQNPPTSDPSTQARLEAMIAEIRRHSPRTRVVVPRYLEPLTQV